MSIEASKWAWSQKNINSGALLVLLALANFVNCKSNKCWPSRKKLSQYCNMSEKSVSTHIKTLIEKNLIKSTYVYDNKGKRKETSYELSLGENFSPSAILGEDFSPSLGENFSRLGENFSNTTPYISLEPEHNRKKNCFKNTHQGENLPRARAREALADVCVEKNNIELNNFELKAMEWSNQHPFWSTRITSPIALRNNLQEGKAFRLQYEKSLSENTEALGTNSSLQKNIFGSGDYHYATNKSVCQQNTKLTPGQIEAENERQLIERIAAKQYAVGVSDADDSKIMEDHGGYIRLPMVQQLRPVPGSKWESRINGANLAGIIGAI